MTLLDAVHAVLSCLSDGEHALVELRTWRIRIREAGATHYADFADFLYERQPPRERRPPARGGASPAVDRGR